MTRRQFEHCRDNPGNGTPSFFDLFQRARHRPPPITARIANLAEATGEVAADLASGKRVRAPSDVIKARKAICDDCPERDRSNICRECGCALAAKQRLLSWRCPLDRWPAVPADSESAQ